MNRRTFDTALYDYDFLGSPKPGEFVKSLWTYEDVYGTAAGLQEIFTGTDDGKPVCIKTENRGLLMAALIASMRSGVPLVLPYSFSSQVIEESRRATGFARIIDDRPSGDFGGLTVIRGDRRSSSGACAGTVDPGRDFLYLYTGGSTGAPKLWRKTPGNLFAEAIFQTWQFGVSGDDVFLSTVPPYHIYGLLFSVLVPFVAGASVLDRTFVYPQEICNALETEGPTVLVSVPMHYRVLKGHKASGHRLKRAFSSAGALDPEDADAFFAMTGTGIQEVYGSTETGGIAWRCRAQGDAALRPFDAVQWKIAGDRLAVKSNFLSPGLSLDREGYFITGDRADAGEDGTIILLGRGDGVVKIAGKRVDLGDVQGKIRKIAGVSDAYLMTAPGRSGREHEIHALVEGTADEAAVRREAVARLEPYAVPRRIKVVERIPLLSTGKYDRAAIEELLKK